MNESKHFTFDARMKTAYARLKRSYEEIKDSYNEMIFRFALAAEYRDESTGTHLVKISDYCTEVGMELGLSKKDIGYLRYASPMHDIGKLVIPDSILKKKGGLTPEEREIMKKHTTLGADIFQGSRSPLLKAAEVISLTHHERYDGTGYPGGLRGESIPIFGRITALADVFDALCSHRPYKEAYGFDESVKIVTDLAGKQFDVKVIKAFLGKKRQIRRIWQATKDIEIFLAEHQDEDPLRIGAGPGV